MNKKPILVGVTLLIAAVLVWFSVSKMQGSLTDRHTDYESQKRLGIPESLPNALELFEKAKVDQVGDLTGQLLVCMIQADISADSVFSIRIKSGDQRHSVVPAKGAQPKRFGITVPDFAVAKGTLIEMRLSTPGHAKKAEATFKGSLPLKFSSGTFSAECRAVDPTWVDAELSKATAKIDKRLKKADTAILNPKMASNDMLALDESLKEAISLVGYSRNSLKERLIMAEELRVKWVTLVGDQVTP